MKSKVATPGRILVVDDHRQTCEMLDEVLSLQGFTVTWRTSAAEALALVRDGEPFGSKRSAEEEFGSEEVDEDAFGDAEESLY